MVNWTVISMMVKAQEAGYTDVVYQVNWLASDTDGTNEARCSEKTEVPTPAGPTFIPYDQLTEPQVIGWVKDALGPLRVAAIEADLNFQILYMQQPPVTSPPLPWS
jgi:hypothetical protein